MGLVNSKRRKCTDEVFSSFSRSRSSSAMAKTRGKPSTSHVDPVLEPLEPCQRAAALVDVRVLDQHRRLQVAAVGHQRVVRVDLALDALLLEDLLDAQHLLDLVAHRELVLEDQRDVLAEVHGARLLVRDHLRAEVLARLGVRLEGHQRLAGDPPHGLLHRSCPLDRPRAPTGRGGPFRRGQSPIRRPCGSASAGAPCARASALPR